MEDNKMNTEDKLIQESLDIKKVLNVLEKDKMDHQDSLVTCIVHGEEAVEKWNNKADQLNHEIYEKERKLEELIAFIAVGYPAYKTVNASSVLDVYKEKVQAYKDNHNGGTNTHADMLSFELCIDNWPRKTMPSTIASLPP